MTDTDTGTEAAQTETSDSSVVAEAVAHTDDSKAVAEAVGATSEATWNFAEGIAGEGEAPEWFKADKYKTVADQAKAYKDLEGRFGSFTGAPEEYEPIELSQELQERGIEISSDDPLIEKAMEFAKENNMNQEGFNQMVNLYAETMAAEQIALENYKQEQIEALGSNAQTRINNLNAWANANLSPEMMEDFQGLATSADSVKTLERLVAMTRSAPVNPQGAQPSSGITAEELQAMQFAKDEYGNRKMASDPAYRRKVEDAMNSFYGTDDFNVTVGR